MNQKKHAIQKGVMSMVLLFTCLSGCSNKEVKEEPIDINEISSIRSYAPAKEGVYYISADQPEEKEQGIRLNYYDSKLGESIPVCQKPNCKHDNNECTAYVLGIYKGRDLSMAGIYQNKLYLVYQNIAGTSEDIVMIANQDGSERAELFTLPKYTVMNPGELYDQKLFYYYNGITQTVNNEQTETVEGSVLAFYDLNAKETIQLSASEKGKEEYSFYLGFKDKKAYYLKFTLEGNYAPVYEYDLTTGKTICIDEKNTIETSLLYNDCLYDLDEKEHSIIARNIYTHEIEKIAEYEPHEGKLSSSSEYGLLEITFAVDPLSPDVKRYTQVYDLKEKRFLYQDYMQEQRILNRVENGFVGYDLNQIGLFDKNMKFTKFER